MVRRQTPHEGWYLKTHRLDEGQPHDLSGVAVGLLAEGDGGADQRELFAPVPVLDPVERHAGEAVLSVVSGGGGVKSKGWDGVRLGLKSTAHVLGFAIFDHGVSRE